MHLGKWRLNKFIIGARVLKTGVSIVTALYLATWLELPSPVLAGVGAVFAVQPTVYRSFLTLVDQFAANLAGASIAIVIVMVFGNSPIWVGIGAIITILFTLKTKNENHIGIAVVTLVVIMEAQEGTFMIFAFERFATIMLGVVAAFIVNIFFLPPKYESKLYVNILGYSENVLNLLKQDIENSLEPGVYKKQIDLLRLEHAKAEQLYSLFKDERKFYKKREAWKARKLVIYRQMITTSKRAFDMTRKFHRVENDLHKMPNSFQKKMIYQIEIIINHHNQLLDSFSGKTESKKIFEKTNLSELVRLLAVLKEIQYKNEAVIFQLFTLVSAIYEYGEHLQHLQVLMDSFKNFHDEENLSPDLIDKNI
jgi:uncharacterized membrane protein YgaE (UPF0421/DUF939 family)